MVENNTIVFYIVQYSTIKLRFKLYLSMKNNLHDFFIYRTRLRALAVYYFKLKWKITVIINKSIVS